MTGYAPGPYGLGQRVPMLVVSPWSTGGYVCSELLDHTSILRFMERRFGVHEPNVSPWRRALCGDLTAAFDFGLKDTDPASLPDTDAYEPPDKERHDSYVPKPPANPVLPKQESGSRPTRPLRYAPLVDGAAKVSEGSSPSPSAAARRRARSSWSPPRTGATVRGRTPPRRARSCPTPGTPPTRTAATT